ncbi:hypothetical protein ABZ922_28825 [Streptomyces shenzhenensis]|uniref:hypothetical protein n=1 Tax=Streptomyces shenzhenensis TaxID=943815 RepID=UPI0033EA210F
MPEEQGLQLLCLCSLSVEVSIDAPHHHGGLLAEPVEVMISSEESVVREAAVELCEEPTDVVGAAAVGDD